MRTVLVHPQAEREFDQLVMSERDTRFDLGEHYRRLEWLRDAPSTEMPRAAHLAGGVALYLFYGARVQMFVARDARTVLLVLLEMIGSEHAQREARDQALVRMKEHFDGGT